MMAAMRYSDQPPRTAPIEEEVRVDEASLAAASPMARELSGE